MIYVKAADRPGFWGQFRLESCIPHCIVTPESHSVCSFCNFTGSGSDVNTCNVSSRINENDLRYTSLLRMDNRNNVLIRMEQMLHVR